MQGDMVAAAELRSLGFEAVQMFFASGSDDDAQDPSPEAIDEILAAGNTMWR